MKQAVISKLRTETGYTPEQETFLYLPLEILLRKSIREEPHLMHLSCVTFLEYNINTTAAFPGASQQWVCVHQVNPSMDWKGSFGKCNLESIGLACGWICSPGFK